MTEERNNKEITGNTQPEEAVADAIFAEEEVQTDENSITNTNDLQTAHDKISELEAKIEEMENKYLRLQADFDNSRRRAKLDLEAAQKYRAQSLANDLLQSLDNFERATKIEADNEQTKLLLQGLDMVYKGILDSLKKEGIEPIESVGKEFDPNLHQAVMQVQNDSFESNVVVEEFQKGYMLKDKVLRPAMVTVNE